MDTLSQSPLDYFRLVFVMLYGFFKVELVRKSIFKKFVETTALFVNVQFYED